MNEKSNKLISLLGSMDRSQRRNCRKLIASPFFSGNEDLMSVYDEVVKRMERSKSLNKREIWQSVFGKSRAFNDIRFRKYTSDIFKLTREYLVQEALGAEPEVRQFLYLSALERQNPDKIIRGVERNWESFAELSHDADYSRFLFKHLLESRRYSLQNYEHRPYERANVEEISSSLDIYYIVVKLRSAIQTQSMSQTEKHAYDLKLVPEIVRFLEEDRTYLNYTAVAIYYYMYLMLTEEDSEEYYYRYKKLLLEDTDQLAVRQAYELMQPALNFCRRRINQGDPKFLSEYLEVYRYGLDHESVFDDGILDPLQFRNTILIALRHGDFQWAEEYIQDYQERLPEKQQDNAVNYNSATLYFYQEDYDKALEYLRDVEYENTVYNLNAKMMLLAIYYETDEDNSLDSLIDAINAYLNRHKEIPAINQQAYRNLVSFTRRLTRMLPGDKEALEKLKNDLAAQKYVASLPWLEEKIAEF